MIHGSSGIGYSGEAVTTSDTVRNEFDGFMVTGAAGNVTYKDADGTSVLLTAVPAYVLIPLKTSFIMATGTTATLILGIR